MKHFLPASLLAFGITATHTAGAVDPAVVIRKSAKGKTPDSESSMRDDGTCPVSQTPETVSSYPSTKRLKKLKKKYGFPMLDADTYKTTYDADSGKDVELTGGGLVTDYLSDGVSSGASPCAQKYPAILERLQLKGANVMSAYEASIICASKCSTLLECSMFSIERLSSGSSTYFKTQQKSTGLTTTFGCTFVKDGTNTVAKFETSPHMNPKDLSIIQSSTFFRIQNGIKAVVPTFPGCNVPVGSDVSLAVTCAMKSMVACAGFADPDTIGGEQCQNELKKVSPECAGLITDDFIKYMLPAPTCVYMAGWDPTACLSCILKTTDSLTCGDMLDDICEVDPTKNFASATPCEDDQTPKKDGCICNACGHVCPLKCLPKIQTANLCSFGSNVQIVDSVPYGGCINANIHGLPDVLEKDFSCALKQEFKVAQDH